LPEYMPEYLAVKYKCIEEGSSKEKLDI